MISKSTHPPSGFVFIPGMWSCRDLRRFPRFPQHARPSAIRRNVCFLRTWNENRFQRRPTAMTFRDVMLNRFKSKWCCLVSNPKLIGFFWWSLQVKQTSLGPTLHEKRWVFVQLVALNNILPTCPKNINLTHKRAYIYIYIYTCDAFSNRQTEQGGGTTNDAQYFVVKLCANQVVTKTTKCSAS